MGSLSGIVSKSAYLCADWEDKDMLKIDVEERDWILIVSLTGELQFSYTEELGALFKKYTNSKFKVIALDLKNMPYLDSFGISRIIKISRQLISGGADFFLIDLYEDVYQILKIATLDKLFKIMTREDFSLTYNLRGKPVDHSYSEIIEEGKFQMRKKNAVEIKYAELVDDGCIKTVYLD